MTKDIKQIQEYNRRKIICAVHRTDNYEKALELDLQNRLPQPKLIAKLMKLPEASFDPTITPVEMIIEPSYDIKDLVRVHIENIPLDLSRVLLTLGTQARTGFNQHGFFICLGDEIYIDWSLTKQALEEQTEQTQLAIYKMLGGE